VASFQSEQTDIKLSKDFGSFADAELLKILQHALRDVTYSENFRPGVGNWGPPQRFQWPAEAFKKIFKSKISSNLVLRLTCQRLASIPLEGTAPL